MTRLLLFVILAVLCLGQNCRAAGLEYLPPGSAGAKAPALMSARQDHGCPSALRCANVGPAFVGNSGSIPAPAADFAARSASAAFQVQRQVLAEAARGAAFSARTIVPARNPALLPVSGSPPAFGGNPAGRVPVRQSCLIANQLPQRFIDRVPRLQDKPAASVCLSGPGYGRGLSGEYFPVWHRVRSGSAGDLGGVSRGYWPLTSGHFVQSADVGPTWVTTLPDASTAAGQILAVVQDDYSYWAGSDRSVFRVSDLGKLLANTGVKGSQAAVLGLLAQIMIDKKLTYTTLPAIKKWTSLDSFVALYIPTMNVIASATATDGSFILYGSSGAPALVKKDGPTNPLDAGSPGAWQTIQQQALGNCFYLASLESLLMKDPKLVSNLITAQADGSFKVSFPGGTSKTVNVTAGNIASCNMVYDNGSWLTVMNLAESDVIRTKANGAIPLGPVGFGGDVDQAMSLLTGQKYVQQSIFKKVPTAADITKLNSLLADAVSSKVPICVETSDHALSVVSFDSVNNKVTLLNPWGVTGTYQPESTLPKLSMVAGQFSLSTELLAQYFKALDAPGDFMLKYFPASGGSRLPVSSRLLPISPMLASTVGLGPAEPPKLVLEPNPVCLPLATDLLRRNVALAYVNPWTDVQAEYRLPAESGRAGSNPVNGQGSQSWATINVGQGSLLVMQKEPVQLDLEFGRVQVKGGAAVFVIQIGSESAVCNLSDGRHGDVQVLLGESEPVVVPMGRIVVLSMAGRLSETLAPFSPGLGMKESGLAAKRGSVSAFLGKFSVLQAFRNSPQIRQLMNSKSAEERQLALKLIKSGAALATMDGTL